MSKSSKILVTGSQGGLGRYLREELSGTDFTRNDSIAEIQTGAPFDVIIHCAFSSNRHPAGADIYPYLEDNFLLTDALTRLRSRKFVYISSIDVYPGNGQTHVEEESISLGGGQTVYGMLKLFSETIVRQRCSNHLILRPGLLLGKYTRKNNLTRMIQDDSCILTLSADSTFNCVTYASILAFIKKAINTDIIGIFNTVSNDCFALKDLIGELDKEIVFGHPTYSTGDVSNKKINGICDEFNRPSLAFIRDYLNDLPS